MGTGDRVYVIGTSDIGEVVGIEGDRASVLLEGKDHRVISIRHLVELEVVKDL